MSLQELQEENEELNLSLQEAQEAYQELNQNQEKLIQEVSSLKDLINSKDEELKKQITTNNANKDKAKVLIQKHKLKVVSLEKELEEIKNNTTNSGILNGDSGIDRGGGPSPAESEAVSLANQKIELLEQENAKNRQQLQNYQEQLEQYQTETDQLKQEVSDLMSKITETNDQNSGLHDKLQENEKIAQEKETKMKNNQKNLVEQLEALEQQLGTI